MTVEPEPSEPSELDPRRATLILLVGRKGSGKSVAARLLYSSYPFDKLAIDVNGDAEPGPDAVRLTGQLPSKFPTSDDGAPRNLHYLADPGSATYRDDLDRAVALGLFPQDRYCLVWIDETGEVTTGHATPAHLRRLLMGARHYNCSALMCCPRPLNIDPLCISQADRIYIYDVPNPRDRDNLAGHMGYPIRRLNDALDEAREINAREPAAQRFWHLVWDTRLHRMFLMPPVPVVPHAGPPA